MTLKERTAVWEGKINKMSLRERGILSGVILALIFYSVDSYLLMPLSQQKQALQQQVTTLKNDKINEDLLLTTIIAEGKNDPNLRARQQLELLEQQLKGVNRRIDKALSGFIPPEKMSQALEALLNQVNTLQFQALKNMPVTSIDYLPRVEIGVDPDSSPIDDAPTLYRHTLRLNFSGSYRSILSYLQQIESLPWKFRWDHLKLAIKSYPRVDVELTLSTLSINQKLIAF